MKLMAYDEDDNAREVDALYFNGYLVGERLLEDLPIKVTLVDGELAVSADWPAGLDAKHWEAIALEYARDRDVFSLTPEMRDDDGVIDHG